MGKKLIHVLPTDRIHSMQSVAENRNLIFHDEFTYIITGLFFSQIMVKIHISLPLIILNPPENLNCGRIGATSNQNAVIIENASIISFVVNVHIKLHFFSLLLTTWLVPEGGVGPPSFGFSDRRSDRLSYPGISSFFKTINLTQEGYVSYSPLTHFKLTVSLKLAFTGRP